MNIWNNYRTRFRVKWQGGKHAGVGPSAIRIIFQSPAKCVLSRDIHNPHHNQHSWLTIKYTRLNLHRTHFSFRNPSLHYLVSNFSERGRDQMIKHLHLASLSPQLRSVYSVNPTQCPVALVWPGSGKDCNFKWIFVVPKHDNCLATGRPSVESLGKIISLGGNWDIQPVVIKYIWNISDRRINTNWVTHNHRPVLSVLLGLEHRWTRCCGDTFGIHKQTMTPPALDTCVICWTHSLFPAPAGCWHSGNIFSSVLQQRTFKKIDLADVVFLWREKRGGEWVEHARCLDTFRWGNW